MQSFPLTLTDSFKTESTLNNLSKGRFVETMTQLIETPGGPENQAGYYTDRKSVAGNSIVRTTAAAYSSPQPPAKIPGASANTLSWPSNSWSWGFCLPLLTSASNSCVASDWGNLESVSASHLKGSLGNIRALPWACGTYNVENRKLSKCCSKGTGTRNSRLPLQVSP